MKCKLRLEIACERDFYVLRSHMDSTRFEPFNLTVNFRNHGFSTHFTITKISKIKSKIEWLEMCTIQMTSKRIKISLTSNFLFQCTILWTVLYYRKL